MILKQIDDQPFISIAVLKARAGKEQTLKNSLLNLIAPTRNEPGCIEYMLYEDKESSGTFYMREAFINADAFEFHISSEHFKAFAAKIDELMDEPINLIKMNPVSF